MPYHHWFYVIFSRQTLAGSAGGLDLARDLSSDVCQQSFQWADNLSGALHPKPMVDAHRLYWNDSVNIYCTGPQSGQVGGMLCLGI